MRETVIEKYLTREVERRGGRCLKWVSPGHNGVPDRLVFLPGPWFALAETKAPGNPLEPLQQWWATSLGALGFRAAKIDSHADVDALMREYDEQAPGRKG